MVADELVGAVLIDVGSVAGAIAAAIADAFVGELVREA